MQLGSAALQGARFVLATAGTSLLLVGIATLATGRSQRFLLAALDLALTLLLCVDLLHFRAFGDLPTVASLRIVGMAAAVGGAVVDLFRPIDLALFAGLPLLLLPPGTGRRSSPRAAIALATVGVVLLLATFATAKHRRRYKGNAYYASYVGFVGYHATDLHAYASKLSRRLAGREEAANRVREFLGARTAQPLSERWAAAAGSNVIVVQLESFQGFGVGRTVGGQQVTPHLDALARESVHFTGFFEQTGFGRTSDAQFTANCSLFAVRDGAVVFEYPQNDFRCLPSVLKEAGYHTALFQPLGRDFWNSAVFDPRLGFEEVVSARDLEPDEIIGLGLSDRAFFRQLASRLEGLPEPFYAFALSVTSHTPYADRKLPRSLELGELEGTRVGWYLHALHYTDAAFGKLVGALRQSGLLDRSLLVVYGDHDGVTRQTGNLGDLLPLADDDAFAWAREEQRVPLYVRLPGGTVVEQRDEAGGQLDLAPTMLGLLGVPADGTVFLGTDLFAPVAGTRSVAFLAGWVIPAARLAAPGGDCYGPGTALRREECAGLLSTWEPMLRASTEILDSNLVPMLVERQELLVDAE